MLSLTNSFSNELPYTNTGDICIAVNPYQWLPIYTDVLRAEHLKCFRHEIPPHAYATSSAAYRGIRDYSRNQSILVSGESGAGKTETVKILMDHIAFIAGKKYDSTIDKVLKANPLLESFGNAKTTRNDNSSRFGKFTQLQFDQFSKLIGSKCSTYLLEKSRVISQNNNERNYHIFHEIFAAPATIKTSLHLDMLALDKFVYMKKGDTKTSSIEGLSDSERFLQTIETLGLLGVSKADIQRILEILAGIMYLGQLVFKGIEGDNDKSMLDPACATATQIVAHLFKLEVSDLEERITIRNIEIVGTEMTLPLTVDQASDGRDALAKEIYARLFLWLVGVVNLSTASYGEIVSTISLLDIFGFESFAVNRFEQLCINYANEKLQQKFTQDVFLTVQAEYQAEGLKWERISYSDNAKVLELIEGKAGSVIGIMAILNEECMIPKGNDLNLLAKLKKTCEVHDSLTFFTKGVQSKDEFCVAHYAGKVAYNINGFVDRNKDTIANETRLMMMQSENPILADVFMHVYYSLQTVDAVGNDVDEFTKPVKGVKRTSIGANRGYMRSETIVTKFKGQLNSLMETIGQTNVQYVRCIKPNARKSKHEFNRKMVVEQLRCAGMIEAIRITRAAYPYRVLQAQFIQRFSSLKSKQWNRESCGSSIGYHCESLLSNFIKPPKFPVDSDERTFEVGKTRVYFSSAVLEYLETLRSKRINKQIETIQRVYRGTKALKWFRRVKKAVICLQSIGRMWTFKKRLRKIVSCVVTLQCKQRMNIAFKLLLYKRWLKKITITQAVVRMHKWRKQFNIFRCASLRIGAWLRMILQRCRYRKLRLSTKEQLKMTEKLAALRNKLKSDPASTKIIEKPRSSEVQESEKDDSSDDYDDLNILARLQDEMDRMRAENERLVTENITLKSSGRKEQFNLDSKIAVVAVGKATIQTLEKERDALRLEYNRASKLVKQFKQEKEQVLQSLHALSEEADIVNRDMRRCKKLYDTERAIRLSQILREREIMRRLRNLLRHRGVDYAQITETKTRVSEILNLAAPDGSVVVELDMIKSCRGKVIKAARIENNIASSPRTSSRKKLSKKDSRLSYKSLADCTSAEVDGIGGVSNHRSVVSTGKAIGNRRQSQAVPTGETDKTETQQINWWSTFFP